MTPSGPDMFEAPRRKEEDADAQSHPLADRLRPRTLEEFVGQRHLLRPDSPLRRMIEKDAMPSMIFWGPPGSGKTSLASVIAGNTQCDFVSLSAVSSGLEEVRTVIERARHSRTAYARRTILFIDEIHRFNRKQQDAFLPFVEDGTIILIGATTENPSFSIVGPLLSRCRVFTLERLSEEEIAAILARALENKSNGFGAVPFEVCDDFLASAAAVVDGDARRALNILEVAATHAKVSEDGRRVLDKALLADVTQRTHLFYDKSGEEHFNLISALHKSLRKSDPDAAIYWLRRMLESGEEPLYVARRLIRFASEDVGLADPQALVQANAAWDAYNRLGTPEGELALLQAAVYLATAPKSNSLYAAESAVKDEIKKTGALPPPLVIRNAPTGLMKSLNYGKGYQYDHDSADHFAPQKCLPEGLASPGHFYDPGHFGFERDIRKRMEWWQKKREEAEK